MLSQSSAPNTEAHPTRPPRLHPWMIQVAAFTATTLTLAIGILQTYYLQKQVRASAWPAVALGINQSYQQGRDEQGQPADSGEFEILVKNDGVGPALLRTASVKLDGQAVATWDALFQRVLGHRPQHLHTAAFTRLVLPASVNRDTAISAMKVSDAADAHALGEALGRIEIDVCYCSIYEECWIASRGRTGARPVRSCETGEAAFED